ncbi:ABC transporter permease [Caulobacter rhizosphaerae]|uniref:ABC transporter permease n=1 Tax=Caulobacter rhizosphaerae TaxID=2010972 RepID=UPI0013D6C430|nr:ABC transporter permease [Caulobacter rhizosphaerae]
MKAETLKLSRHPATLFLVWIYPIFAALAVGTPIVAALVSGAHPPSPAIDARQWAHQTAMMLEAPYSAFGRILVAGFVAVVFAGEYGWNTWKLIIPARSRTQLVATKWLVVVGLLLTALIAADLIVLAGTMSRAALIGPGLPSGLSAGLVLGVHLKVAAGIWAPLLSTLAFASLAAVFTRSILPTVLLAIGAVLIEPLLGFIALAASPYAPSLVGWVIKATPFYNTANLEAAAKGGGSTLMLAHGERLSLDPHASAAVLGVWMLLAAAATLMRFERDDLN